MPVQFANPWGPTPAVRTKPIGLGGLIGVRTKAPRQPKTRTGDVPFFRAVEQEYQADPTTAYQQPSEGQLNWLNEQNWETPEAKTPKSRKRDEPKLRNYKDLQDYEYQMEPWQAKQLTNDLANQPGYRAPENANPRPKNPWADQASRDRAEAEGRDPNENDPLNPKVKETDIQTGRMSWEEYDALTADQKAAVDFNARVVKARQKDLKMNLHGSGIPLKPEILDKYRADTVSIFGEGGNSDVIALNTVELLKEIDYQAAGDDIDEWLSLNHTVDAKQLKSFKLTDATPVQPETQDWQSGTGPEVAPFKNLDDLRSPENQYAAVSTAIRKSADQISMAMTAPEKLFWSANTAINPVVATEQNIDRIPYGFGGDIRDKGVPATLPDGTQKFTFDRFYSLAWDELKTGRAGFGMDEFELFMDEHDFSNKEREDWFRWVYHRVKNEQQYGSQRVLDPTGGAEMKTRTPEEILEFIGLGDKDGRKK